VSSSNRAHLDIQVFIGIKTHLQGDVHKERWQQIQKTWLLDAMMRPEVDLKFFDVATPTEWNDTNRLFQKVELSGSRKSHCLCCKDEAMFTYFLEHYVSSSSSSSSANPFSPWFCSFDDDNYVIVENLLNVLRSYQRRKNATKIYVGRPSVAGGVSWRFAGKNESSQKVHFLTGGAGYCISNELMALGRTHFTNFVRHCETTRLPDDMAVGHIINTELGMEQRLDQRFHSHLEQKIRTKYTTGGNFEPGFVRIQQQE
jgi:hypothetical protein